MTSRRVLVAAVSLLLVSACTRQQSPGGTIHVTEQTPAASVRPDISMQNRINAFMYVALVPKLEACWKRLQGEGAIRFKYTYRRSGTNWVWSKQEVERATIPADQEAVAQECMTQAARETAFPMEAAEVRGSDELNLHWQWPVPLPSDITALGRMIGTGGGGGSECAKSCVTCDCPFMPNVGVVCSCASSCVGYTAPCLVDANQKGCTMRLPKCATGIVVAGGVVIASAK